MRRVAGEPPKPEVKPSPSLSEATLREALALEHWQAIKASGAPTRLRAFLAEFADTKCASLARAEFERLAECEWSKLAKSKDEQALDRFHLLFSGVPQAQLAKSRIASLVPNPNATERSQHNASGQGKFVAFVNRSPVASAFLWLFVGLSLLVLIEELFVHMRVVSANHFLDNVSSALFFGLVLLILSLVFIFRSRCESLRPVEVIIYWFGCALYFGFIVAFLFKELYGAGLSTQTVLAIWGSFVVISGILTFAWWKARQLRASRSAA